MTPRQAAAYLAPALRADDVDVSARQLVRAGRSVWQPERRLAMALAERLLEGVGDRPVRVDPSERVVHVRAPLSAIEEAGMPSWWKDFAPVDGAGVGGHLDDLARRL